jgi:hypothetical protein
MKVLAALFVALFSASSLAGAFPEKFSATYVVKKGFMDIGEVQRSLIPQGNGKYVFESTTTSSGVASWVLKGKITERSTFTFVNNIIQPIEYFYQRTFGKGKIVKLSFDWGKNTVTNDVDKNPWVMPLEPSTLDKLVYQISLMRDMAPGKKEYTYKIADGGKLKTYQAVVVAEEETETPMGKFHSIKIRRVGDKRGTTLWCAPKLNYLPVRIEQTDDDDFTAVIKSVDGISAK